MGGWTDEYDKSVYPSDPELVLGIVAPIGTPTKLFISQLTNVFAEQLYETDVKKLSEFAAIFTNSEGLTGADPYKRYNRLMDMGNETRRISQRDDLLALYAASQIARERRADSPRYFKKTIFIIDQLKRPEEAYRLRRIYGEHFMLLGVSCPKNIRRNNLINRGMSSGQADNLIRRDEDEEVPYGQRVSKTFHLSDIFFQVIGNPSNLNETRDIKQSIIRYKDLILGTKIITPTRDEYGMFLASSASLRSSSLARQVGAAILNQNAEVLGVGANEVPSYGGGLYWGDEHADGRDHQVGFDESDRMKRIIVAEILQRIELNWNVLDEATREKKIDETLEALKGTRVLGLTEFARAVHAEMEALSSAHRIGVSASGGILYTTTFPCHGCAKHIVAAGVKRVVYIEPYAKSRAIEMYGDSICVKGESTEDDVRKVQFDSFVGVAPRKYLNLFSRYNVEGRPIDVKDSRTGALRIEELSLRVPFSLVSYISREQDASRSLNELKEKLNVHREHV